VIQASDGLRLQSRTSILADRRREAVEDFPILREIQHLLKTRTGRRMRHWDRLALCADLLKLGHSDRQIGKSAGADAKTVAWLRHRMTDAGILTKATGKRFTKHGHARRGKKSPEYRAFIRAKRCCNGQFLFASFRQFYDELGPRPPGLILARIEDSCPFGPSNIHWTARAKHRPVTLFACAESLTDSARAYEAAAELFGWMMTLGIAMPSSLRPEGEQNPWSLEAAVIFKVDMERRLFAAKSGRFASIRKFLRQLQEPNNLMYPDDGIDPEDMETMELMEVK